MVRISDLLNLLKGELTYEFQGSGQALFRGLGLRAERRGVRRCLYVLPEVDWHPEYPRMLRKDERPAELEFATAIANGASGIVAPFSFRDHPGLQGHDALLVDNTLEFAYRAARAIRCSLEHQKIIGITGSAGKSTTKLMIADALKAATPDKRVQVVRQNRNIAAQTIWQASWAHGYDYSVLEVAGSAFLRFPEHDFTLSPDIAIITSISEAHLDYLGDLRTVAEHKSHLFDNAPRGGVGLVNIDTPHSDLLIERAREGGYRPLSYGESLHADIRMTSYSPENGTVTAETPQRRYEYRVGAHGRHMAINSLAVIGTLEALNIDDTSSVADSLASFEAAPGRGKILSVALDNGRHVAVTDESFNANPASMRAAIEAFVSSPHNRSGRKIAILGDIAELGPESATIHRSLHDAPGLRGLDEVHFFGEKMAHLHAAAPHPNSYHWEHLETLTSEVIGNLRDGDRVLVKASHSTGLNAFVGTLTVTD